ncbi:MAG: glycosyltransferase [Caldilineaceae bacterium]
MADFLASGKPPIYIGFGSMANRDPEKNTQMMIDALVHSGERGLLSTGWGGLQSRSLPDTIFKLESCPHSWLFPRMKAIVHHGGAGTTAAAFRAGRPQIVVPFFADQPFWGKLINQLGVGVKPLPNKTITVESLTSAIEQVASKPEIQQKAMDSGQAIRAEDGVSNAVKIIKKIIATEF